MNNLFARAGVHLRISGEGEDLGRLIRVAGDPRDELVHRALVVQVPGLTEHHTAHSGRYAAVAALYGEGDGRRGHPVWCRISRRGDVVPISLAWPTPTGDFQGAEPLARQAVQLRTRRVGPDHQNAAADLAGRRGLLAEHNLDEARKYRQAFDIYLRVFGDER